MVWEIEDVPLTLNFAIRVEKLVGHSRCEDSGLLTDAVLEG
jgi:hypothetical protein